jgi:hypothetical protein
MRSPRHKARPTGVGLFPDAQLGRNAYARLERVMLAAGVPHDQYIDRLRRSIGEQCSGAIAERGAAPGNDLPLSIASRASVDEGVELASEFFQYAEFINAFRWCNDQDVFC